MLTIALIEAGTASSAKHPSGWDDAVKIYTGKQTQDRIAEVESQGLDWYFLTESGLLKPNVPIRPKAETLDSATEIEVAEWHLGVANSLMFELWAAFDSPLLSDVTIELHASSAFVSPLKEILTLFGLRVQVMQEVPA